MRRRLAVFSLSMEKAINKNQCCAAEKACQSTQWETETETYAQEAKTLILNQTPDS